VDGERARDDRSGAGPQAIRPAAAGARFRSASILDTIVSENGNSPLGDRLREERSERGLSLRELARRLDVSASLVSQIETGKIQPSVRTLYAMVSELGVSLDELFDVEPAPARAD
jgi:ribosome-binding protein aMBF1 (putative translation factor)